jgi:hypothetical protein
MRYAGVPIFLILAAVALPASDPPASPGDDLYKRAMKAHTATQYAVARKLLEEFIEKYPQSPHVPDVLYTVSRYYKGSSDRRRGLAYLRRLVNDYPDSEAAGEALDDLPWDFTEFPEHVHPGHFDRVPFPAGAAEQPELETPEVHRDSGPPSKYSVYLVPVDAYRRAVDRSTVSQLHEHPVPGIARKQWKRVGDLSLDFLEVQYRDIAEFSLLLKKPGLYAVEEDIGGFRKTHWLRVNSFGVLVKALPRCALVYVVDTFSGEPVENATVGLRSDGKTATRRTDGNGLALFENPSKGVVSVSVGDEFQHCPMRPQATPRADLVYITTDRPVYRPGQTVHFKAVRRRREGSRYSCSRGKVRVSIIAPRGAKLQTKEYEWNEAGSLSGTFELDEEPALGFYSVAVGVERKTFSDFIDDIFVLPEAGEGEPDYWQKEFIVESYRKPEFSVSIDLDDRNPRPGSEVRATLRSEYYFGGPVTGGYVEWEVLGAPRWYGFEKPTGFATDDPRAWLYEPKGSYYDSYFRKDRWWLFDDKIASGEGRTGPDGTFVITAPIGLKKRYKALRIRATVTDVSNYESRAAVTLETGRASLEMKVQSAVRFCRPGERVTFRAEVRNTSGSPASRCRLHFSASYGSPVPGEDEDDEEDGSRIEFAAFDKTSVRADRRGIATFDVVAERGGLVRVFAVARDDAGVTVKEHADLWVVGDDVLPLARVYGGDAEGLDDYFEFGCLPDRRFYDVGDTAKLLVVSRHVPKSVLLTVEGHALHGSRVVRLENRCSILEVPLLEDHAPNVYVKLASWHRDEPIVGGRNILVYPRGKFVDVDVRTDRPVYGAGEDAEVSIATRRNSKPVAAEVELGIVDESVFEIRRDRTPDVRSFFIDETPELARVDTTTEYEDPWFITSSEEDPWGGLFELPDAAMEPTLLSPQRPPRMRKWFPDTFFWSAHVRTGSDGKASLKLKTPDSLTRWRVVARAVSGADGFGSAVSSVCTRKNVVLRLIAPRFYTEGDEGTVLTVVHNNMERSASFAVSLQATGAMCEGRDRRVRVKAGEFARLDWRIRVGAGDTVRFNARALSSRESDAVQIDVPVRPWGMERQIGETARVKGTWRASLALPEDAPMDRSRLDVIVSTPLSAVTDALPFLVGYPYGCVEQTMSRFLPSATALRAMKRLGIDNENLEETLPEIVSKGLQRLYNYQHDDGGWGWWKHDKTDPFMTAYVVSGLAVAGETGVAVDEKIIRRGVEALKEMKTTPFSLYALALAGEKTDGTAALPSTPSAENAAYLILAGVKEKKGLADKLPTGPPAKATPEGVRSIALTVRALHSLDPGDKRIPRLVEWLMACRCGRAWFSTLDTAYVVYALSAVAKGHDGPRVRVAVNGKDVPLKSGCCVVPGADLKRGENTVEVTALDDRPVYASALLSFHTRKGMEEPAPGFLGVKRTFERIRRTEDGPEYEIVESGGSVNVGDRIDVVVGLETAQAVDHVMVECPIAAGLEPRPGPDDHPWYWTYWYCRREFRDDRICLAARNISGVSRHIRVRLRPMLPGVYRILPATAFAMYDPVKRGGSSSFVLRVLEKKKEKDKKPRRERRR